jgi:hypothetical protein
VIFAAWRKICWMHLLSVASWFFTVGYNMYIIVSSAMPGQHVLQYECQISLRYLLYHINDFHIVLSAFHPLLWNNAEAYVKLSLDRPWGSRSVRYPDIKTVDTWR